MQVRIKQNSWLGMIAAKQLRTNKVAVVFGSTIYLWETTREDFLKNLCWVKHEITHVHQYKKLGLISFLMLYLLETIKHGYYNNRFEKEARQKEYDVKILEGVQFK